MMRRLWFVGIVAVWAAFGVVALFSPETLADLWSWVRGLPLAAEIVLWIVTLPFMLALAVLESSWTQWVQVVIITCLAAGWTLASIPRETGGPARLHWQIRPGHPHDLVLDRHGLHRLG